MFESFLSGLAEIQMNAREKMTSVMSPILYPSALSQISQTLFFLVQTSRSQPTQSRKI